jgi:hypothetical protein
MAGDAILQRRLTKQIPQRKRGVNCRIIKHAGKPEGIHLIGSSGGPPNGQIASC